MGATRIGGVRSSPSGASLLLLLTLAGCRSTPPPKPLEQLTAQERAGDKVFNERCSLCHYDRQEGSLHGPSLLGIYKKPYLPSGAPANDERVRATIVHGRNNMPALGNTLDDEEIDDVLRYLHTL